MSGQGTGSAPGSGGNGSGGSSDDGSAGFLGLGQLGENGDEDDAQHGFEESDHVEEVGDEDVHVSEQIWNQLASTELHHVTMEEFAQMMVHSVTMGSDEAGEGESASTEVAVSTAEAGTSTSMNAATETEVADTSENERRSREEEQLEAQIDTFLEFTGTQDRGRARRYLEAADMSTEQAVNLFLSGSSLDVLEASTSDGPSTLQGLMYAAQRRAAGAQAVPSSRALWLLGNRGNNNDGGGGNGEGIMAFSGLSRSEMDDLYITAAGGSGAGGRLSALQQSNQIVDEAERANIHVESLRAGIWDKAPEVGAGCLRSVENAERYLKLGLAKVIADNLPLSIQTGDDGVAVRFLQLIECVMRMISDGHSECVKYCGWWFIPARRSGSRRYAKSSFTEIFLEKIVPDNDIEGLRQMWLAENFDSSWRDRKTEAEMLACALNLGCSIEMLEVLVDPVNGCRANVNPDPDRHGSLSTPLMLAARGTGFLRTKDKCSPSSSYSAGSQATSPLRGRLRALRDGSSRSLRPDASEPLLPVLPTPSRSEGSPPARRSRLGRRSEETSSLGTEGLHDREQRKEEMERWSRDAVEVLLDTGAVIDEEVMASINLMTKSARELILAEKAGSRVSERLRRKAEDCEKISDIIVRKWWRKDARRFIHSLLKAMLISKHASTRHRAMEVLAMMIERFRPYPCIDAVTAFGDHEYEKLMQVLQSVLSPENDDMVGLTLALRIIHEFLRATQREDKTEYPESKYLGIHAQLCLSLCRFGITSRLREEKFNSTTELSASAKNVVETISSCIVDQLGLSEETLAGRSAALLDVCMRLHNGDESVLEQLVWMMGKKKSSNALKALPRSDDLSVDNEEDTECSDDEEEEEIATNESSQSPPSVAEPYGIEGITPFEFEQSGLPSALLHFLLGRDVSIRQGVVDDAEMECLREERMHALLSAMPPPVVSNDEVELDEDDDAANSASPKKQEKKKNKEGIDGGEEALSGADNEDSEAMARQDSLTLESVQQMNTIASKATNAIDTSLLTTSALFRLVSKLQTVVAVHAAHNFPVLAHDSAASVGGVRALVSAIKIRLRKDDELGDTSEPFPEADELVVQALPLTPVHELQKQVLRAVKIVDPRYIDFCVNLVGCKIRHRMGQNMGAAASGTATNVGLASPLGARSPLSPLSGHLSPRSPRSPGVHRVGGQEDFSVALILRYDPATGAHLLQNLGVEANKKNSKMWFLLSLREYVVLERVFDAPYDSKPVVHFAKPMTKSPESVLKETVGFMDEPKHVVGSQVAVWWCGDETLGPGWREARILASRPLSSSERFEYDVAFASEDHIFDEVIRVGDRVRLIDDAGELERLAHGHGGWTKRMRDHCGKTARVTSVRESQVTTDGLGKFVYNIKALQKLRPGEAMDDDEDEDDDGDDVEEEENGILLPSNLKPLMAETEVPEKRVFKMDEFVRFNDQHAFSVFLLPDGISNSEAEKEKRRKAQEDSENQDVKAASAPPKFNLGDRIEGRYAGKSRYYKGRIARVNADGTYDIAYDDGDSERGVDVSLICHIGEGPGKVVSYDFRKVFPNSAGRALFDALRREDDVLNMEYNFVTRGFEHQPDFYAKFSKSLEREGRGVFARFQTMQQAVVLYERIQSSVQLSKSRSLGLKVNTSTDDGSSSIDRMSSSRMIQSRGRIVHASVDIFPEMEIAPVVERDILAAFEQVRDGKGRKRRNEPPPPPGHRAQIALRDEDLIEPISRLKQQAELLESPPTSDTETDDEAQTLRWISATIVATRQGETSKERFLTCVLDDGRIAWDIPESRARIAQRNSRVHLLQSKERQEEATKPESGRDSPVRGDSNHPEPVHLSRQFTAFGRSTAYKRIKVDSEASAESDDEVNTDVEMDDPPQETFTMQAPRVEVDFLVSRSKDESDAEDSTNEPEEDAFVPVLANQHGETSLFQALFQLHNMDTNAPEAAHSEFFLQWRVRCVFPGDVEYEHASGTLMQHLPWRTPRALAYYLNKRRKITVESFCKALQNVVPDLRDWAVRNRLHAIVQFLDEGPQANHKRENFNVNWAAICAAYSQLCQRPLETSTVVSPAVSPIRSPTLLKKDALNINVIEGQRGNKDMARLPVAAPIPPPSETGEHDETKQADLEEVMVNEGISEVVALLDECGIDTSVAGLRDALVLLHLLYSHLVPFDEGADPLAAAFGKSLPWRSDTLSDLLAEQLGDPLAIATRCFPRWVAIFPREFSFLFRRRERQMHFRCTALGVSRAVAWLQDEATGYNAKKKQLAHITLEISNMFKGVPDMVRFEQLQEMSDRLEDELRAIELEHCIGQLQQDLVKVNRSELLRDAELLMKQHMHLRSELVVQFLDETGAGEGVTADFYSSVSERLQQVEVNKVVPMWVDPSRDMKLAIGEKLTEENGGAANEHIVSSRGLFPQPLLPLGVVRGGDGSPELFKPLSIFTGAGSKQNLVESFSSKVEQPEGKEDELEPASLLKATDVPKDELSDVIAMAEKRNSKVVQRFRFLGRIMAKALLDGMNVPIPLSPEFFMLIQQRQRGTVDALLPISTLKLIEGSDADDTTVNTSMGIVERLYSLHKENDIGGIAEILQQLDLRFLDPSQPPLATFSQQPESPSKGSCSSESEAASAEASGKQISQKNLAAEFEKLAVPKKSASSDELLRYAEAASRQGLTQSEIDAALTTAGHSKMHRWKAIKGSQKTRVQVGLDRAEKKQKEQMKLAVAAELVPGGADRRITTENLAEFLELVLLWWLGNGIARQADAFCDGLRDVLGNAGCDALLFNFSHSELRRMLCGREEILWNDDEPLLGCIVPMQGYTEVSPAIQMLVRCLKEMNMKERSQFLSFVTSQPRVPLSGLPQIKVYPPMMECIPGIVVRLNSNADRKLEVGDRVRLAHDFHQYGDAEDGPLKLGDVKTVTNADGRARVDGWWYNPRALVYVPSEEEEERQRAINDEEISRKQNWFRPGDEIRTVKTRAKILEWRPGTDTLVFDPSVSMDTRRSFKSGMSIERVRESDDESGDAVPPLRVEKLVEEPQAIQMRPYLRPKATTCAKTLYLPSDYEDWQHMLEVFKTGAFQDAKLGGIHEQL